MKKDDNDSLVVARIRKPHGVAGLMKIHSYSGSFEHIATAKEVRISFQSGVRTFTIEKKVPSGNEILIKLKGVDTPEAVRELVGGELLLERSKIPPCKKNEFFIADLVGCNILFDKVDVGQVVSVVTNASSDLLEVEKKEGGKVFLPMLPQFIGDINVSAKTIELLESWFLE